MVKALTNAFALIRKKEKLNRKISLMKPLMIPVECFVAEKMMDIKISIGFNTVLQFKVSFLRLIFNILTSHWSKEMLS